MNHQWIRSIPVVGAVLACGLILTACSQAAPTPRYVYITPPPTPWIIYVTVTPPPTASAAPSPIASHSAVATATPAGGHAPAITAQPSALAAGAVCSTAPDNKAFFSEAVGKVHWDVYCAVLPSHWFVQTGTYALNSGGTIEVSYTGPGGAQLVLDEGAFCTGGGSACAPSDPLIGPAPFGDLAGTLYGQSGHYVMNVNPGTTHAYAISGSGLSEATFKSIAASLHKVTMP